MKIIKNNYMKDNNNDNLPKLVKIKCDKCDSELEITEEDTYIGAYGEAYVICPCCYEETMVKELDGITLTKDNIEFPIHFVRTNKDMSCGVKEITSEEIIKDIKLGIEYFRENKDEFVWYTGSGDMFLTIFRFEGDEEYMIVVSKDFYETYIPFESKDYDIN